MNETMLIRHADKGKWTINENDLKNAFPEDQANLILNILKEERPGASDISLKLEGLKRSMKLADEIFEQLPPNSIFITSNSGKDRAVLTNSLITGRINQLEQTYNKQNPKTQKRVDILQIDESNAKEIISMLADADEATWAPYAEMMEKEKISEQEAIARWVQDMNSPISSIEPEVSPKVAANRYRSFILKLKNMFPGKNVPVTIFGVGHSGALAQIEFEKNPGSKTAEEMPDFCQIYKFDENAELIDTKKTEL